MEIRITPIEADCFYHIYNRGINGEVIFKTARNYQFFINKIKDNLLNVCDVYAYCLMPNHFHLLVKIKSDKYLNEITSHLDKNIEKGLHASQNIFSKQFSKVFNSYSQAFNKENNRHGALIESPFKRKLITSEEYLRKCVIYIHQNPGSEDFKNYKHPSYKTILSNFKTLLKRNEVLEMFEDKENFIMCHKIQIDYQF